MPTLDIYDITKSIEEISGFGTDVIASLSNRMAVDNGDGLNEDVTKSKELFDSASKLAGPDIPSFDKAVYGHITAKVLTNDVEELSAGLFNRELAKKIAQHVKNELVGEGELLVLTTDADHCEDVEGVYPTKKHQFMMPVIEEILSIHPLAIYLNVSDVPTNGKYAGGTKNNLVRSFAMNWGSKRFADRVFWLKGYDARTDDGKKRSPKELGWTMATRTNGFSLNFGSRMPMFCTSLAFDKVNADGDHVFAILPSSTDLKLLHIVHANDDDSLLQKMEEKGGRIVKKVDSFVPEEEGIRTHTLANLGTIPSSLWNAIREHGHVKGTVLTDPDGGNQCRVQFLETGLIGCVHVQPQGACDLDMLYKTHPEMSITHEMQAGGEYEGVVYTVYRPTAIRAHSHELDASEPATKQARVQ